MHSIDEMAYSSPLRHLPPLSKLLFSLALLVASILSPTPLVPIIVLAIGISLLYCSSNFRLPSLVAFACANTFILLAISVLIIAFTQAGAPIWSANFGLISLSLSREGANLGILIFLRAAAGFSVLLAFASSTPLPYLFHSLQKIGLPSHVCELTILIYRYSFMLLEQLAQMLTAAECRQGFSSPLHAFSSLSLVAGNLFSRSMDFAERAQNALACRNYSGQFVPLREPAQSKPADYALIALTFIALFSIGVLFQSALKI